MTLIKFHPGCAPSDRQYRMLRFSDLLNDFYQAENYGTPSPLTNIVENPGDFQIELSIPGYNKDEIKVLVNDGMLEISGEHKADDNKEAQYHRKEFRSRSFNKRYELPDNVSSDQINARYENGILRIMVPKKPEAAKQAPVSININ